MPDKNKKNNSEEVKIPQNQLDSIMSTMNDMKETIQEQKDLIESQTKDIDTLKESSDPSRQRRKKKLKNRIIKDEERLAKMYVLNIELTKSGEFVYFDDDRQRLINEEKVEHELLITSIERVRNVVKAKDEHYLFGQFNCLSKNKKKISVDMPFIALDECKSVVKAMMYKKYTKPKVTNEGSIIREIKDESGHIIDEYEVDLINKTTKYFFDLKIVTEGSFKDLKFERVPEEHLNLL
jgi:hypothetical protein